MTEQEWLTSPFATWMLKDHLQDGLSLRKLRLFAVACCRDLWRWLTDERSRCAVGVAERFADDQETAEAIALAYASAWEVFLLTRDAGLPVADWTSHAAWMAAAAAWDPTQLQWAAWQVAYSIIERIYKKQAFAPEETRLSDEQYQVEARRYADMLRDIAGNPFRPVAFEPQWRSPQALALAQGMYEDRCFADMPLLADALEEMGCTNSTILSHCRSTDVHVRGCWVVDLVLGRQ